MPGAVHDFLFGYYPYIALSVFLLGSLLRFDREQYTWRSGSSQLLRRRMLRVGSNLFHIGILLLMVGHFVGLLTPSAVYHALGLTTSAKQILAMVAGGVFGTMCFIGLTMLVLRRLIDPRIRATSSPMDIAMLLLIYVQLILGLVTIPVSMHHLDGANMVKLADWAQHVVTLRPGAAAFLADVDWIFKLHIFLGLTIFLMFPFSRLVHIWSAPVWYLGRRYQVVRRRTPTAAPRSARPWV
ncbi:MAG: respiratory nitrate reductase subunit gamma [Proteobacteria bacterium]|nr:respiratory nitrate reductase subunit gamma [Pseudomonadota bacterium]